MCGEEEETIDHIIFDCEEYHSNKWTEMAEDQKKELIGNEHILEKFNMF